MFHFSSFFLYLIFREAGVVFYPESVQNGERQEVAGQACPAEKKTKKLALHFYGREPKTSLTENFQKTD